MSDYKFDSLIDIEPFDWEEQLTWLNDGEIGASATARHCGKYFTPINDDRDRVIFFSCISDLYHRGQCAWNSGGGIIYHGFPKTKVA